MKQKPLPESLQPSHIVARGDVADYVGEMVRELARMAKDSDMTVLAYLLDLAEVEARTVSLIAVNRSAA